MDKATKTKGTAHDGLLRVTDKYYLGKDLYNVIVYTRRESIKDGVTRVKFGDRRYYPTVKDAIEHIIQREERNAINPDVIKVLDTVNAIKDVLDAFLEEQGENLYRDMSLAEKTA